MYTVIPDINTITKHINRYLDKCLNKKINTYYINVTQTVL